jgi:trimethylamine---corrinoid protein Co-methyltransferase
MELQGWRVLSQEDMQRIHEAALQILGRTGVLVQCEEALSLYSEAGAIVDRERQCVRFPREVVERALASLPHEVSLYGRNGEREVWLKDRNVYALTSNNAAYIIDINSGDYRLATKQDTEDYARLADGLSNTSVIVPAFVPHDVPEYSSHLHSFQASLMGTEKPLAHEVHERESARAIFQMAQAVAGSTPLAEKSIMLAWLSPTSPLIWAKDSVEALIETATWGVPCAIIPCPMSGMTSPVTLAGTIAQQAAEWLSGMVLAQHVRPGTPLTYFTPPMISDLKEGTCVLGSPECVLFRVAGGQMAMFYGVPGHHSGQDSDAHCHDEQNAWERALITVAAMDTGPKLVQNGGLFSTGMTASLEQLVLDDEMFGYCLRILRGVRVTDDTLAVSVIDKVGHGGTFLAEGHTLRNLRKEMWIPSVSCRKTYEGWREAGCPTVVDVARVRAQQILANHRPSSLDPAVLAKLDGIVRDFEESHASA